MSRTQKEYLVDIGQRIKQLRQDKNLTQAEFSSSLKMTQNNLSNVENGFLRVNLEQLIFMRDLYGANLNWILTGTEQMYAADSSLKTLERKIDQLIKLHKNVRTVRKK